MDRISKKTDIYMVIVLIISIIITLIVGNFEEKKLMESVAKEYIELNTRELTTKVNSFITNEINVLVKLAKSEGITQWMNGEYDDNAREHAIHEVELLRSVLIDNNIFLVFDHTYNFYYLEGIKEIKKYDVMGKIIKDNPRDIWYFALKNVDGRYDLNVDIDRFLNTMRVWINVKVLDNDGNFIGALGTGLYVDSFLNDMFNSTGINTEKVVIIDEFKSIQLDSESDKIKQNSFDHNNSFDKTIYYYGENDPSFTSSIDDYYSSEKNVGIYNIKNPNYDYFSISPLHDTGWHVVMFYNSKDFASKSTNFPIYIYNGILIAVIILFIRQLIERKLVSPVDHIVNMVRIMDESDDYSSKIPELDGELGFLTKYINKLNKEIVENNNKLDEKIYDRTKELTFAYRELAQHSSRLENFIDTMPIGVFKLNSDKKLIFANGEFLRFFNVTNISEFCSSDVILTGNSIWGSFNEIASSKKKLDNEIFSFNNENGEKVWVEMTIVPVSNEDGTIQYEGIIIDVSERKLKEYTLLKKTQIDSLTRAYQRDYLMGILESEIENKKYNDIDSMFVIYDFDDFKNINDKYGHPAGDKVLIEITSIINDVIGDKGVLGRIGGEEFALVIKDIESKDASILMDTVMTKVRNKKVLYKDLEISVTISAGITKIYKNDNIFSVYRRADKGLYNKKNSGKNGYEFIV